MDQGDIQRGFVGAGWRVTDDPAFELVDRRGVLTYWVRVILTPRQAAVLLEEERDNHHR